MTQHVETETLVEHAVRYVKADGKDGQKKFKRASQARRFAEQTESAFELVTTTTVIEHIATHAAAVAEAGE